jgi:hypothetical protein
LFDINSFYLNQHIYNYIIYLYHQYTTNVIMIFCHMDFAYHNDVPYLYFILFFTYVGTWQRTGTYLVACYKRNYLTRVSRRRPRITRLIGRCVCHLLSALSRITARNSSRFVDISPHPKPIPAPYISKPRTCYSLLHRLVEKDPLVHLVPPRASVVGDAR